MGEYTEPDMCLKCDSPTSLCQCEVTVIDWGEYLEETLTENKRLLTEGRELRAELEQTRAMVKHYRKKWMDAAGLEPVGDKQKPPSQSAVPKIRYE